jgi:hypothetical protein
MYFVILQPSVADVQVTKMPVLQFYVFGSAMLGSLVATLATGSRRATAKISSPQQGLRCWTDHLSSHMKLWIMHQGYGNDPATVQKLRESQTQEHQQFAAQHFPGDKDKLDPSSFSARAFLVRLNLVLQIKWRWHL